MNYDKSWIANKMFDDSFIDIILNMCQNSSSSLRSIYDRSADASMEIDDSEEEFYKIKFTTLFFLGVIVRSESRLRFAERILPQLLKNARTNLAYSQWIIRCFSQRHIINEFVANNWSSEACRMVNSLVSTALKRVHAEEKGDFGPFINEMMKYKNGSPEN